MATRKKDKNFESKRLKLISVAYKEASLDTPSFRASVNHFQTKVELLEDWIEKTVGFTENHYNVAMDDFNRAQSTFLTQLLPSPIMLSNGFVDNQLYTPWLVESFNNDYAEFSAKLLKIISGLDSGYPNALLELMNNYIEPYKSKRANFEYYQNKHDGMLNQHQAVNISLPGVTPSSIRENALQLFEVRKGYLDASLELIGTISKMKLGIDKFVMQIIGLAQLKSDYTFKESGKKVDLTPLLKENFVAYSDWVENSMEAAQSLQQEMENAKRQVLQSTAYRLAPSRDLNDYNVKAINSNILQYNVIETPKESPEKCGWLYMKTSLSSPQRDIWVRRWCFLKNSVFGIFLLSLSKTYVEETDKFGIFLTNVEYEPNEDRKFCFGLKIIGDKTAETDSSKELNLTFQAESLEDLKSWLKAFAVARKYASRLEPNSLEYDMAFQRFPPEFFEFASSTTTSMDQALTSFSSHTKPLVDILDEALTGNASTFSPEGKLCHFSMAVTPMATKLTQVAILANFYRKGNWLPDAVVANMWGSSDWSGYAIFDEGLLHLSKTKNTRFEINTNSKQTPYMKYPDFYPPEMKVSDIQFKSLFFTIDENLYKFPDDLLLFNFSGFWCPNKRQKFSATCYVTANHLYCYMNSMGFISLTHLNLQDLVSVEEGKSSGNVIKIYNADGIQLRMYIYFKDHRLVAEKLQYLLENKTRVHPKDEQEIFRDFELIDQKYQEKLEEEHAKMIESGSNNAIASNVPNDLAATFWSMSATAAECFGRSKELQKKASITYQHTYDVSPKTLMHILFGDQSNAFPRSFFLANRHHPYNYVSEWKEEKAPHAKPALVREIRFGFSIADRSLGDANYREKAKGAQGMVKQKISKILEGKFYEVDQDPFIVKVVFCHPLRVTTQYLIMEPHETDTPLISTSSTGSLFFVYYRLEFIYGNSGEVISSLSFVERTVLKWAFRFSQMEYIYIKKIIRYYMERIGAHGKLIKAVKMCGKIGVLSPEKDPHKKDKIAESNSANDNDREACNLVEYNFSIVLRIILKATLYRIVNFTFICLRAIVSLIFLIGSGLSHINNTLAIALILSVGLNVLLFGRSTITYWLVRRAENTFRNLNQANNNNVMQRAVSIKDLDLLTTDLAYETENLAFNKFEEINRKNDYIYKDTRQEMAFRRNELLVELKILQDMERELVRGDYRKFLLAEETQCETVKNDLIDVWDNATDLRRYCESCNMELERLTSLLL
ncbi:related to protein SIP3 [Zygosaccharomyces bailii]|nr:related to protein SIP3 [Zygosaccharomyces bailii]